MTRSLCFTVDTDRDVNECVPGRKEAVSLRSENARFTSSETGTNIILDLIDEMGIKATFFAEARTLENISVSFGKNEVAMHGLDHEDMTGEVSGIPLNEDELYDIMETSAKIIKERTGTAPKGFRAPYMRINETITNILPKFGVRYDSSLYADLKDTMYPYDLGNGVKEIPVPVGRDNNGKKIFAYLWPMHEGLREHNEYAEMANTVKEGVLTIATHSWHITESISGGVMNEARKQENIGNVRKLLTSVLDSGYKAVTMSELL